MEKNSDICQFNESVNTVCCVHTLKWPCFWLFVFFSICRECMSLCMQLKVHHLRPPTKEKPGFLLTGSSLIMACSSPHLESSSPFPQLFCMYEDLVKTMIILQDKMLWDWNNAVYVSIENHVKYTLCLVSFLVWRYCFVYFSVDLFIFLCCFFSDTSLQVSTQNMIQRTLLSTLPHCWVSWSPNCHSCMEWEFLASTSIKLL